MGARTGTGHETAPSAWELEALARLDAVARRCAHPRGEFEACLGAILDAAIFVTAADKGNLQLVDPLSGSLVIRAQRGFEQPFLDYFSYVDKDSESACGAALSRGQQVVVQDVATSELFAGTPVVKVLLKAHVRAVQSTPLMSRAGCVLGMLSTHFTRPTHLGERALRLVNVLAGRASDYVERKLSQGTLQA